MSKKILVTGSSGYIGQHLCLYLCKMGYIVTGVDRYDIGGVGCHTFVHQNILDTNDIQGHYDAVVHLAALVQVNGGQKAPMEYYRNNVVGTMNMLERISYDNFIFASTCQAPENHVYGTSKSIGESIIRQYCGLNNKPYTVFRFGNVIGSAGYAPTNTDGLMYNLIKAKSTGVFYLYGNDYDTIDGTAERDYIHVIEVCHSIQKAIERPSCVPDAEIQPFYEYLGHGHYYTVKQCVDAFKKANKCDFEVIVEPRRKGDPDKLISPMSISPYMPPNVYTLNYMMKL